VKESIFLTDHYALCIMLFVPVHFHTKTFAVSHINFFFKTALGSVEWLEVEGAEYFLMWLTGTE